MTAAVKLERIERGIFYNHATQRYVVRMQDRPGCNRMATTTVDDLQTARSLVRDADDAHKMGEGVRERWGAKSRAKSRREPRQFATCADEFLEERSELILPDHIDAEPEVRHTRLTSDTVRLDQHVISKHLLPAFGGEFTTEIDGKAVKRFVRGLAAQGLAISTQRRIIRTLRSILQGLPAIHQPVDINWKTIRPVPPDEPLKRANDQRKMASNGKPKALPYPDILRIARALPSCSRIVVYLIAVLGLRRGEAMGLDNRHFAERGGRLWVTIEQQRDLRTGHVKRRVKTETSRRCLPVPDILRNYIEVYWDRYHAGYRPSLGRAHPRHGHQLTVTSTGRAVDASFMPAQGHLLINDLRHVIVKTKHTFQDLGYRLRPHMFRKSFVSTLRNVPAIIASWGTNLLADTIPSAEASLDELREWAAQMAAAKAAEARIREISDLITGAVVSAYAGHTREGTPDASQSAADVTDEFYNLQLDETAIAFCAVADFMDWFLTEKIGSLIDTPDERDTYRVVDPHDPQWIALPEASELTGKPVATLTSGIRHGTYEGILCWYADGDPKPPGPRYILARSEVLRIAARQSAITRSAAARRLGMSNNFIDGAIERGRLVVIEWRETAVYIDIDSVRDLHDRILRGVAALFDGPTGATAQMALARLRRDSIDGPAYDRARSLIADGATFAEAAKACGLNENTVRSRARRGRWTQPPANVAAPLHELLARPRRISDSTFHGWVSAAIDAGYLVRLNGDRLRMRTAAAAA